MLTWARLIVAFPDGVNPVGNVCVAISIVVAVTPVIVYVPAFVPVTVIDWPTANPSAVQLPFGRTIVSWLPEFVFAARVKEKVAVTEVACGSGVVVDSVSVRVPTLRIVKVPEKAPETVIDSPIAKPSAAHEPELRTIWSPLALLISVTLPLNGTECLSWIEKLSILITT